MDRYNEIQQIRPRENFQDRGGDDPRIDSPNIEVTYPAQSKEIPVEETKETPEKTEVKQTSDKSDQHVCQVDVQTAIQQNLNSFVLIGLIILGIGYMIGKK